MLTTCLRASVVIAVAIANVSCSDELPPVSHSAKAAASLDDVAHSHVEGNVPPNRDFDVVLRRDLKSFFATRRLQRRVGYELLRDGPTQAGIGYPKFYVWVQLFDDGAAVPTQQFALSVAAVEGTHFEVVHVLGESTIRADPSVLDRIFPSPVSERIRGKLRIPL